MTRSVVLCLFSLILLGACDSVEVMKVDQSTVLRQFSVGDRWIMSRTDSLMVGGEQQFIDTLEVTSSRTIAGEVWFAITSTGANTLGDFSGGDPWFSVRADGLWRRMISPESTSEPSLFLPYPSEVDHEILRDSGLRVARTAEEEIVQLENGEVITAIPYELSATDQYRPFHNAVGDLAQYQHYPVEGVVRLKTLFSADLGFVRLSGIWITIDSDAERLNMFGERRLDLIQFIPGA